MPPDVALLRFSKAIQMSAAAPAGTFGTVNVAETTYNRKCSGRRLVAPHSSAPRLKWRALITAFAWPPSIPAGLRTALCHKRAGSPGPGRQPQTPGRSHLVAHAHLPPSHPLPDPRRGLEPGSAPMDPQQSKVPASSLAFGRSLSQSLPQSPPETGARSAGPTALQNLEPGVGCR
jgi:hypothetical protein